MKPFSVGDTVRRNIPDARYQGKVVRVDGENVVVRWPVGNGYQEVCWKSSQLKHERISSWEELDKMSEAVTTSGTGTGRARKPAGTGAKVAAQKNLTRQRTSATAPKATSKALTPAQKAKNEQNAALMTKLNAAEKKLLATSLATIQKAQVWALEGAQALEIIAEKRLYRENYKSMEEFCRAELSLERNIVYKQIQAAKVVREIEPFLEKAGKADGVPYPKPANERQARELVKLKTPAERAAAFIAACDAAGSRKVTAEDIAREVHKKLGPISVNPSDMSRPRAIAPAAQTGVLSEYKPSLPWVPKYELSQNGVLYLLSGKDNGGYDLTADGFYVGTYPNVYDAFRNAEQYIANAARPVERIEQADSTPTREEFEDGAREATGGPSDDSTGTAPQETGVLVEA